MGRPQKAATASLISGSRLTTFIARGGWGLAAASLKDSDQPLVL
jgi:hypothetical protein